MLSLAYPEQSKSPYKYREFYPIDMINSYLHFFKTVFFDNESVRRYFPTSFVVVCAMFTVL